MPPAIIPDKAIILHTLEDAGIAYMDPMGLRVSLSKPEMDSHSKL